MSNDPDVKSLPKSCMVLYIAEFVLVLDMNKIFVAGIRQLINLRSVTGA